MCKDFTVNVIDVSKVVSNREREEKKEFSISSQ